MKHIITFILSLSFFASIGQVRLSDTANNGTFSYHLGSNFRGQYPKASCYLDRDASGAFAIRRVTGAVVTPYVSMSNYVLNGEVDTVFSSYIEKLNGIIMVSCGGSTPIETFAYCGNTIGGYFYSNDTINSSPAFDNFEGFASFKNGLDTTVYRFATCSNEIYQAAASDFTNYDFQNTSNIGCNNTTSLNNGRVCDSVKYYNLQWKTYNWTPPSGYYQQGYPQSVDGNLYDTIALEYTTKPLLYTMVNVNNDTSITNEYTVDFVVPTNKNLRIKRILGVTTTGLSLDTTNSTLTVTAKPIKTSGQTYAASSFKIEKIEFADITAGTIEGGSYNPNLGEQTIELPITTGKNTFKVSVEDTDGNIAYSIFQVTKTAL